jgi:hypothetical protein
VNTVLTEQGLLLKSFEQKSFHGLGAAPNEGLRHEDFHFHHTWVLPHLVHQAVLKPVQ